MKRTRIRGAAVSRTLSRAELEKRLDGLLRQGGDAVVNRLRDEAREASAQLGMADEFLALDQLIGTFLGTRDAKLETAVGQARKRGLPYDPERFELFKFLFRELRSRYPVSRAAGPMSDSARTNLAFFEAYFSNYIEGTRFPVEQAVDIIFKGVIPEERPEDAHDILGTYRIVADYVQMQRTPRNFDEFIWSMKARHATMMALRPDKTPGQFKMKENWAGGTRFVQPELVLGTLERGFEVYRGIESALHRAIFMMFLVSEVHPFSDGNGRIARIMMNSELVAADEQKIIIPNVYRDNYVIALKALTQSSRATPLIQVLDFAQKYAVAIRWDDFNGARSELDATNAFLDSNEADQKGVRLTLPKEIN